MQKMEEDRLLLHSFSKEKDNFNKNYLFCDKCDKYVKDMET